MGPVMNRSFFVQTIIVKETLSEREIINFVNPISQNL